MDFVHLLSPLHVVDEDDLDLGLRVFKEGTIGAFDAVLAASAIRHEVEALVSADEALASIPDLQYTHPASLPTT